MVRLLPEGTRPEEHPVERPGVDCRFLPEVPDHVEHGQNVGIMLDDADDRRRHPIREALLPVTRLFCIIGIMASETSLITPDVSSPPTRAKRET